MAKFPFLTGNEENDRLIKWVIAPVMISSLLLMGLVSSLRTAGGIYFILSLMGWVGYWTPNPRIQDALIGIKKDIIGGMGLGILGVITFFVIQSQVPNFSLGLPSLPMALSSELKGFIIIYLAPLAEEVCFRGFLLGGILTGVYRHSFWRANFEQAAGFAIMHFIAYGILLENLQRWSQIYGEVQAILGLLIGAALFGLFTGWLVNKTRNLLPGIVMHMATNAVLYGAGYVILY